MTDSDLLKRMQNAGRVAQTRRQFLVNSCLGSLYLATCSPVAAADAHRGTGLDFTRDLQSPLAPLPPQYPARAKRVIYLHMAGAPSQLELFDYKPELAAHDGQDCPQSFLEGKRFAFLTGVPKLLGPQYPFHQAGDSGMWISDRMPELERHIDDLCFIKSMRTDQFNHAPAQLAVLTGSAQLGKPSLGAWATYGLGTFNQNLPGYIVLLSGGAAPSGGKPLWGSGFLPSVYQGVQCRSQGEPVLYLDNPDGVGRQDRRSVLDAISAMNSETHDRYGDPETLTRMAQYEMAFRMQIEAAEAFDIGLESDGVRQRYGVAPGEESFANNCLVARRLAERGVRFIQLFDWGWDSHGTGPQASLGSGFQDLCRNVDRPIAALLDDLKATGLLDETLVVWGGEFGRTPMQENRGGQTQGFTGRDHNPGAFTMWMAGGGVKGGHSFGETDELGYEVAQDPVELCDLHATILYLLGFDHHALSYSFQGLDQKLTGVEPARVVSQILG